MTGGELKGCSMWEIVSLMLDRHTVHSLQAAKRMRTKTKHTYDVAIKGFASKKNFFFTLKRTIPLSHVHNNYLRVTNISAITSTL